MSKLFDTKTGQELKIGDAAKTFRGEACIINGWTKPRHSGSTGRVLVILNGGEREFFPNVIGAEIRED